MMETIHDSIVQGYEVNFEEQYMQLHIQAVNEKLFTIHFKEYLAHEFKHSMSGSILMDIEEISVGEFLLANEEKFEELRGYCWPVFFETVPQLIQYFREESIKCFIVFSSLGLNGFVFAKEWKIIERGW